MVSLDTFYNYKWPEPHTKLILDFVEGFQYIPLTKYKRKNHQEYDNPIRLLIRNKSVKITEYVIRVVLGFEEGVDVLAQGSNKGFSEEVSLVWVGRGKSCP